MKRFVVVAVVGMTLGGCALQARMEAQHEMLASKATYKTCLDQHPVQTCEAARASYEADLAAYRATPRGLIVPRSGWGGRDWLQGQMQWQAQQDANFWSVVNAQQQQQANFWGMVGAMNGLPH